MSRTADRIFGAGDERQRDPVPARSLPDRGLAGPGDVRVFDGREETHRGAAAGTSECIDREDALEQRSPAHPARMLADAGIAGLAI